ncbi:MAG: hypothetical protein QOG34_1290 [Frankiaceae bacterium]|nr:hypothetical protein [Frankiaceae bacterium]
MPADADTRSMPEIAVTHRTVPRALAVLPGLVVAACVRVLTLATPPIPVRMVAAAVIALACWTAYRLLTASLTVGEGGVHVRGVMYDADIPWADLHSVQVEPSNGPIRFLLWGMVTPRTVTLVCSNKMLRPVGMLSGPDDEDVDRAVGAMRVRSGVWRPPVQRQSAEDGVSVG